MGKDIDPPNDGDFFSTDVLGKVWREAWGVARTVDFLPPWQPITDFVGSPAGWVDEEESELAPPTPETIDERFGSLFQAVVPRVGWLRSHPTSIPRDERDDPFPDEAWFFINGIGTDVALLRSHGRLLEALFGRRFELIYNPTDGVMVDLVESVLGRTFDLASEPAAYAYRRLLDALEAEHHRKVVLLAHSQGGIIASNIVRRLIDEGYDTALLEKLEIYTFASAADSMEVHAEASDAAGRLVPYVEHFANLDDPIARLGILRAFDAETAQRYCGEVYVLNRRGHLFNTHYLPELRKRAYESPHRGAEESRLYAYLEGARPDLFMAMHGEPTSDDVEQ